MSGTRAIDQCRCGGNASTGACGCCEGTSVVTPAPVENRPGRASLLWRAGTHGRFKRSMVARLAAVPALRALTTRDDDDPAIALIDAWAVTLDVLTFYQERIANEHYLRTATERRSVLELARAIGYELAPGVSATASLAFALETAPGAPAATIIPAGTKVQSIPGQGERPQLYETSAPLAARGAWNAMPVRWRGDKAPVRNETTIFLAGHSTGLAPGDPLLVVGGERAEDPLAPQWDFRRVREAKPLPDPLDPSRGYTRVTLDRPLGAPPAQREVRVFGMRQRVGLFGGNAPDWSLLPASTRSDILELEAARSAFAAEAVRGRRRPGEGPRAPTPSGIGGFVELPDFELRDFIVREWPRFNIAYAKSKPATLDTLFLDNAYRAAVRGAWLVIATDAGTEQLYRITDAGESGRADFGISGKSTRVKLSGDTAALVGTTFWTSLREAAVFLQTEEFELADAPLKDELPAGTTTLDLEHALTGDDVLPAGRTLLLSGIDGTTGAMAAESLTIDQVIAIGGNGETPRTRLVFRPALGRTWVRTRTVVHGNVVDATHGETIVRPLPDGTLVTEVLGGGNAAVPFQRFTLRQRPLTHVAAPTTSGRAATLVVRVDGVQWDEVPTLHGRGPAERVYVVRHADDGAVTVQFGDGTTGARLPTGTDNVTAIYRVGTGLSGLVGAGQLSLLLSRPLGVKEVRNPLPSSGADEPERLADARQNAPLTVVTLDRVVSLRDYEHFARAFAGIGKAAVTLLWTGEVQTVHLTVGLADGGVPAHDARPLLALREALDRSRHAIRPVIVQGYVPRPIRVTATVAVDPRHEPERVLRRVRDALLASFDFARRAFAEDATESAVIALVQSVPGVTYVDLDALAFVSGGTSSDGRLPARPARLEGGVVRAAELLTLAPQDIQLTPKAP